MSGRGAPSVGELLDLDERLDRLAAGRPVDRDGLVAVAARLASLPEAMWDEVAPPFGPAARRDRQRARWAGRRSAVLAVAAALVAAVVVAGLALTGGGPTGPAPAPAPAPGWQLAGFVDQPAWDATGAPGAGGRSVLITCPSPSTCYADQPGGPPAGAVVEVTGDRGSTWSALDLPAGTAASTGLSCSSRGTCAVGAAGPAGSEVLTLATGTGTWSSSLVPDPAAALIGLACPAPGECVAVGHDPAATAAEAPVAFHTTDAGAHWSAASLPGPFVLGGSGGLSCAAQQCVAVGLAMTVGTAEVGAARYSTDGGATWSVGSVPAGVGAISATSCPDQTLCVAVGASRPTGAIGSVGSQPPFEVLASADGGRTWSVAGPFVGGAQILSALSCPSADDCWAAGTTTRSGGLLAVTHDGGATWAPVAPPTSPLPGSGLSSLDLQRVTSVSCPAVGSCVAIGLRGTRSSSAPSTVALRSPG